MRIKLHLMGALKHTMQAGDRFDPSGYLEVDAATTPRDLIRSLGVTGEDVLVLINGKPVPLDEKIAPDDRVVLMYPDSHET